MAIKHKFVSAKSEGGDATLVGPNEWNDGHDVSYGNMYAMDADIEVATTPIDTVVQVPSGLTGGLTNGFTFQNDRELRCDVAGIYMLVWSMSVSAVVNDQEIEGAVLIDGVEQESITGHSELVNATKASTMSGTGIINLAVNQVVSLALENHTAGNNTTVKHLTLTILGIG